MMSEFNFPTYLMSFFITKAYFVENAKYAFFFKSDVCSIGAGELCSEMMIGFSLLVS